MKNENAIMDRIKARIAYHANEHRHTYEIGKGVMDFLARDLLADFKAAGGLFPPVALDGDVYVIYRRKPVKAKVIFIGINTDRLFFFNVLRGNIKANFRTYQFTENDIGRSVFLTQEEAEKAVIYAVNEKAFAALLDLVTDICKRNGIKRLVWSTNKKNRMNHLNGCNMTVHRDYANKACPGDYLYNRHGEIAAEVNRRLGATVEKPAENKPATGEVIHTVKAGETLSKIAKQYGTTYQKIAAYNGIANANLIRVGQKIKIPADTQAAQSFKKGDKVKVLKAVTYTGKTFKTYYDKYDVIEADGDRVVIGIGKTVTAAVNAANLKKA